MKVCIDSHIAIWGIKRQASSSQLNLIEKTEKLFNWLDEQKHEIIIPTIVIAEILSPEPFEKHPVFLEVISQSMIIADFNIRASQIFAEILYKKLDFAKGVMNTEGIRKDKMKFDYAIVATALAYGADCIYAGDADVKTFGNEYIEVRDIPNFTKQSSLFT